MGNHLLPHSAGDFEKALSEAIDFLPKFEAPMASAPGIKIRQPPTSFLPYLEWEYGLGPISRFFVDKHELIAQGIAWQRIRGSHQAVAEALSWIDYSGTIEVFPARRRRWNLFMLALDQFRENELPDLEDIEYLVQASVAERSKFWRGFKTYDIRGLDYGHTKWGNTLWSAYSGARLRPDGAKWSFGRLTEQTYTLTEADLTALGVWIASGSTQPVWGNFTWAASAATPWNNLTASERLNLMVAGILDRPAWIVFYDADDEIIGYRRAKTCRGVVPSASGVYRIGAARYAPADGASSIYFEAQTDFGEGFGSTVAKWALSFDNAVTDAQQPGRLWNTAAQVTSGTTVMPVLQSFEFGRTVRERFKVLLRLPA